MSDNIYNILQKINSVEPVHQPQIDSNIEKVEPQSDFVKSVTELEKKYQVFKEDATPLRRIMDFDNHARYWSGEGKYQDQYSKLYDKLVPSEGKSDTVEGELLRAVGKIIYRHGNDGDNFSNGSYEWIEKHVGKFDHLDDMADKVIQYVLSKKGDYTPNNFDWLSIADYGPGQYEKDWQQVGCNNCGGTGEIEYENDEGEEEYEECDSCDGNGWIEQTSESVNEAEKSLKQQTQENLGNNIMQDNTKSNGILEGVRRVEEGTELKNKTDFDDNAKTGDYYITSKGHKVTKTKSGIKHDRTYKDEKEKDDMDESVQFSDTIENSKAELEVVKESSDVRNHPIYTNEEAWDHYQKEVTEQENEEVVDVNDELNEIARLAGLNNEEVTVGGNEVKGLWSDWTEKDQEDDMEEACGMSKKMKEGFDPDDFEGEIEMDGKTITYHADVDKEQNKVKVTKCSDEDYKEACQADAEAEWDARDADVPMDEEVVAEGPTRKDFQMVADLLKDNPNMADRKAKAQDYCDKFKAMNPRFDKEKFMKACGVEESIEEDTVEEGNEFTKARLDAIKAGKDSFTVDGKTYKVSGDTSQEKMNEDIHVQVTVDNEQDALNLLRKLSGMPEETETETEDMSPVGSNDPCSACDCDPCGCDEAVEEERDIELANTPNEKVAPVSAVTTDAGAGLNGPKKQYPLAANPSDNPIEEDLWTAYETMVDEVKKATNED
jgi:uncharacterized Ntn-hydrolase superfamily protein